MQNLVPAARPVLAFEPVSRKYRYDGWTPERQRGFIAALAETGSVTAAARRINMSAEGAYYLRRQPGADGFRAAWLAALDHWVQRLVDVAIERAIEGVPVPVFHKGEQVGERRWYNDRLTMFILRHHLSDRYGGPGLAPGTRNRATIEREAAENCPVCKARNPASMSEADRARAGAERHDDFMRHYTNKVKAERQARLRGDIVAADFALRQLTEIEFIFCVIDRPEAIVAFWNDMFLHLDDPDPAAGTEDSFGARRALLKQAREAVWAQDAMLRPAPMTQRGLTSAIASGATLDARRTARKEACTQMAAAQAQWEAAATEEGWRALCAGEGAEVMA